MTRKHVNLLFLLMLCNVASVRAEFGFGFISRLFGLAKTMFWMNNYSPEPSQDINSISSSQKPRKGLFKSGWKWVMSSFGFITPEHVEKLGTRVNNIETKVNNMVQDNNEQLDQLKVGSENMHVKAVETQNLVEQFSTKSTIEHKKISEEQAAIKKQMEQSKEILRKTIHKGYSEINKKVIENSKTFSVKIDQIDKQKKEAEEMLRASTVRVNGLFQALQKLTVLFYLARESYEQREKDLLLGFYNLSTDEFKQFQELKFGAYSGSVVAKKMPALEFKNEETRNISLREQCLMAYAVHAYTQKYQKNVFKDFDDNLD